MTDQRQRGNELGPGTARVASNIRAFMASERVSGARLKDRLEDEGWPLSTAAISRMLSGQRRIDADDIFAIAQALRIPPRMLFLPALGSEDPRVDFHGEAHDGVD